MNDTNWARSGDARRSDVERQAARQGALAAALSETRAKTEGLGTA